MMLLLLAACSQDDPVESAKQDCAPGQLWDPGVVSCVQPWQYGSPTFEACAGEPDMTLESLAQKAATFDAQVRTLHIHPALGWPKRAIISSGLTPEDATWNDVVSWNKNANDGLWSSLYLAAQAFRYASTDGEEKAEALEVIKAHMRSYQDRLAISGAPGNLVRTYVPPGIKGLECPTDLEEYRQSDDKSDDRWVQIDEAGCLTWLPMDGGDTWVDSGVCVGESYAGWCFRDNTSKDEYSGHMFTLGAVLELVDDAEVQEMAGAVVTDVLDTLLNQSLTLVDADGRETEHGDFSPAVGLGFNAAMTLSFLSVGERHLDAETYGHAKDCFVGESGMTDCPVLDSEPNEDFLEMLPYNGVHWDYEGCLSNDNNASMHLMSLATLLWHETDPDLREHYHTDFEAIWAGDFLRNLENRKNAFYDVFWAAFKRHGEDETAAYEAVTDAACGLAKFPSTTERLAIAESTEEMICLDRLDRPMGASPRGPHEQCMDSFIWWNDQYLLEGCEAEPTVVDVPAAYLLPYWAGRYFGFIDPSW